MNMRTFHAASVQEAIRLARRQLGPDAMLLTSKRISGVSGAPDQFAVSFAYQNPVPPSPETDPAEVDKRQGASAVGAATHPPIPPASRDIGASARTASSAPGVPSPLSAAESPANSAWSAALAGRSPGEPYQLAQRAHQPAMEPTDRESPAATASSLPPAPAAAAKSASAIRPKPSGRPISAPREDLHPASAPGEAGTTRERSVALSGAEANAEEPLRSPNAVSENFDHLREQMLSLRREMLQLAGSVRRVSTASYRQGLPSEAHRLVYDLLVEQEFHADLIERILAAMGATLAESQAGAISPAPPSRASKRRGAQAARVDPGAAVPCGGPLLAALQDAIASCVDLAPEPGFRRKRNSPLVISLVGPPGAGKTTTLVKLAVRLGEASRFPLQLISMDNFRVGASEQLRAYAAVLGVGFDALTTVRALDKAVSEYASKEIILVDTPGLGWRDFDAAEELAAYLRSLENGITYMVAPASMRASDLERLADLYEGFQYRNLIFTKLDETTSIGPLVSESWRRRKPLSYFANGQRIPEDLEPASRERICERILPAEALAVHFAA
jgi:flagellar biosynthesis protein FlhF